MLHARLAFDAMWLGRQSPNRYLNPTPGRVSPMFSRSTVDFSNGFVWNVREKTPTLSKIWMFKHWLIIFLLHWMGRIGVYWRYIPCSNQLKFAMGVLSLAKTILAHSNLYNTWLTFWMNIYIYMCSSVYCHKSIVSQALRLAQNGPDCMSCSRGLPWCYCRNHHISLQRER